MLDVSNCVVGEIADRPRVQRWQVAAVAELFGSGHRQRSDDLLENRERIAIWQLPESPGDRTATVPGVQRELRLPANKRPSRPTLTTLDRLEKETRLVTDQLLECGYGRLPVCQHLERYGHDLVAGGEIDEPGTREVWCHDGEVRPHRRNRNHTLVRLSSPIPRSNLSKKEERTFTLPVTMSRPKPASNNPEKTLIGVR